MEFKEYLNHNFFNISIIGLNNGNIMNIFHSLSPYWSNSKFLYFYIQIFIHIFKYFIFMISKNSIHLEYLEKYRV